MSTGRVLLILLAVAVIGFAPAPFPRKDRAQTRDDLIALQGMWKLTEQGYMGNNYRSTGQARVKGDVWTFVNNGSDGPSYTLTLDQRLSPRAFEWKSGGSVWIGSYRLEGRKLTIVYLSGSLKEPHKRPTDFSGRNAHYLVYERE